MAQNTRTKNRFVLPSRGSLGKLDVVMVAVVFLQSLLIAWFLFLIIDGIRVSPIFRLMQGIAILFAVIVPVFILLDGFQFRPITEGFFVPLALYAIMFPLFNSLVHHENLFLDPMIIFQGIIGGIGFGLIGLGAYHMKNNVPKTFALATAGITIIFLSTPMILAVFLYVLTGNWSSLPVTAG